MATGYTPNLKLARPANNDLDWGTPLISCINTLDTFAPTSGLCVSVAEVPSSTLNVRIGAGSYVKANGTIGTYAGTATYAITASTTLCLWLVDAGTVSSGASFPTTAHVRLATVTAGTSTIVSVVDSRVTHHVAGTGLGFVSKTGDTIAGDIAITGSFTVATSGTGTLLFSLDSVNRKVGFFAVTPQIQATALVALTAASGTTGNTISDVGTSFSQGTLNNNFKALADKVNALVDFAKRFGLMGT